MPFKHTCWLLQAFPSTVTRAALTSQSERTFSGFMLQCNYSLCKGTSLEFAYCSVTAYCALIQCEDILYKMTWSVFCDVPKQFAINTEVTTQWPSWCSPTFAPLINQFTPPLHHRSISSPHLCTNDQSVHHTFAPLINQFTPPLHHRSISSPHLCTNDQSVHHTFAPLINQFTPPLHHWSISSPHFALLINQFKPPLHHWSIGLHSMGSETASSVHYDSRWSQICQQHLTKQQQKT